MKSVGIKLIIASFLLVTIVGLLAFNHSNDMVAFNSLIDSEDYPGALELAENMVKKSPDNAEALNNKALALVYLEREEEALVLLEGILRRDSRNDDALQNMSWALYNLEQYEKSYEFSLKSMDLRPNSAMEITHHGNVLLSLGKYSEARDTYINALDKDDSNLDSIYGHGYACYCLEDYEKAIQQFDKYIEIIPDDEDALSFLAYSWLYSNNPEKALEKVSELNSLATQKKRHRYDTETMQRIQFQAYKLQAEIEKFQEQYEQALETLKKAEKLQTDDDFYSMLGDIHYRLGNYSESIRAYNQQAQLSPDNAYPHIQNVYNYLAMEDTQSALETAEKAITLEPDNPEAITALGNIHGWETRYRKAFEYFQQSVQVDPDYVTGHVNSMWALYNSGLFRKCLEYGQSIVNRFPSDPDIYGYIADSWARLQEIEKAVENYKKAAEHEENPVYFYYEIAMWYYYDQQFEFAETAIESALALEPENETCLLLKEEIANTKKPLSDRIADFVEQNYLYSGQIKNLDSRLNQFRQTNADAAGVYEFIESIRLEEDIFTFCFSGEEYDLYWDLEEEQTVFYKKVLQETGQPVHYFDIDFFGYNTANEFIEIAEELPDKENSVLVIDLRDNGGGLMESCAEMMDYLLHSCSIGNLVYRDGTNSSWYSDEDAVRFKDIFLLTNGYTASSSEMLALGLKTYLDDVTVVGEPTFGKGVGQTVFDSRKDKVAVMLVNFYWDVQDENLVNSCIRPDIQVSGDLDEYLEKVRAAITE
ncbi:MAG: tetratricopeptide repeat protein [Thermoclostridium sp.]|nr:tetratricopeptide repeat protein [Thermoclostridium sp.]